jgi:hypothetical protein
MTICLLGVFLHDYLIKLYLDKEYAYTLLFNLALCSFLRSMYLLLAFH